MNIINIYIRSCGCLPDQDYAWTSLKENYQQKIDPPSIVTEINQVIDKESFSVVLIKKENYFYLLIANFEDKNRKDYVNRTVKNTILIVADQDYQNVIANLTSLALLQSNLIINIINDNVLFNSDHKSGFMVKSEELEQLLLLRFDQLNQTQPGYFLKKKICQNTANGQQELSEEIKNFGLPDLEGFLIILTKYQEENTLINAEVWRGLSNLCGSNTWQIYELKSNKKTSKFPKKIKLIIAFSLGLIVFLTITLFLKIYNLTQINLDKNTLLWQKSQIKNYTYTYQHICFCPERENKIIVSVSNGKVISSFDQLTNKEFKFSLTVEQLFKEIEKAIKSNVDQLDVTYNQNFGYPESINIDPKKDMADEEYGYRITKFKKE